MPLGQGCFTMAVRNEKIILYNLLGFPKCPYVPCGSSLEILRGWRSQKSNFLKAELEFPKEWGLKPTNLAYEGINIFWSSTSQACSSGKYSQPLQLKSLIIPRGSGTSKVLKESMKLKKGGGFKPDIILPWEGYNLG